MANPFASIEQAIDDMASGKMIILVDDEDRENEGDLVVAARFADDKAINFMAKFGRGLICLPMSGAMIDQLELPMMVQDNASRFRTAFTVSIEAKQGVSTGISAKDRAHTIQTAIAKDAKAGDIISPGHVFPLRAKEGGVLVRAGQTEGSVDLARLAGLEAAAVICEIINDDGTMSRLKDLQGFAKQHGINIVSVNDLIAYRMKHEQLVQQVAQCKLPIENFGEFDVKVFENDVDGSQHLALIKGPIDPQQSVLVRVHSECLTGDIFASTRCDCGQQLQHALAIIAEQGGVLVYLRQEGRGIGLANKIKAYALQEKGMDTVEANRHLGFPDDKRDYGVGAQILKNIGIKRLKLLTNNPRKIHGLGGYGIEVSERVALEMPAHKNNQFYLHTKKVKLGHLLDFDVKEESALL